MRHRSSVRLLPEDSSMATAIETNGNSYIMQYLSLLPAQEGHPSYTRSRISPAAEAPPAQPTATGYHHIRGRAIAITVSILLLAATAILLHPHSLHMIVATTLQVLSLYHYHLPWPCHAHPQHTIKSSWWCSCILNPLSYQLGVTTTVERVLEVSEEYSGCNP